MLKLLLITAVVAGTTSFRLFDTLRNQLYSTIDKTVDKLGEKTSEDPDVANMIKSVECYVKSYNYDYYEFNITTKDDVILTIFRVRSRKAYTAESVPVILQHGVMSSGVDFLANPPQQAPGFFLADMGYDVYLPNTRTNKFSSWSAATKPYFYYVSFMEMAEYDMPAIIDSILSRTGFKNLHYIGHSRGTTIMFALLASKPEYNDKVRLFAALAPIVYLDLTAAWSIIKNIIPKLKLAMDCLGYSENRIFDSSKVNDISFPLMNPLVCSLGGGALCNSVLNVGLSPSLLRQKEHPRINSTRVPVYSVNTPAGTTVQDLTHYFQMIESGKFAKYNFDFEPACHPVIKSNKQIYRQSTPPEYDLGNLRTRLIAFHSVDDTFAGPEGVARLYPKVKHLVLDDGWYFIEKSKFLHLDFLWAIDAIELVYLNVLNHMRKVDKLEDGSVRDLDELFSMYQRNGTKPAI